MGRKLTLEERIACFTVDFVKAVARINENLAYREYFMDIGKKRIPFPWITGANMTAEDCLKEADKFQEGNAVGLSGEDDCVAYMMCEGDLCDKLYGYSAYHEDIYGDGKEAEKLWNKLRNLKGKYNLAVDFSGRGSLIFRDDAYTKIHRLLKYEFYDGERTDSPIVIAGPDGTTTTMLRAYAYGGRIGQIATDGRNSSLAKSREYPNYLSEAYFSEGNEIDRKYLEYMEERYAGREEKYKGNSICEKLSYRLRELLHESYGIGMLTEPEYLDLILKAAQKRFVKRDMKKSGDLAERRIQTAIVKQHVKKDPEDGWCVVDMQYTVKKELSRSEIFTPDMVVFDKNRGFGFIELKYADASTGNLGKHYTDTRNIIQDSEAVKIITEELKERSFYLWGYGLISDAIYQAMKASDVPKLWQGFLFVGGRRENAVGFAKGLAKKYEDIRTDGDCRFAFFPYEEENSADSINKIRLDFHSMEAYEHFVAGEKNE